MASPLTSSQFVRLMDERLREVAEGVYSDLPSMIPTLFNVLTSTKAWEEFFQVGDVPDIPEFNGKLSFLSIAPGFHTKIEPKEHAGGLQFQRKLIDDKQYSVLDDRASGLMRSAQRTREKKGVRAFAFAFSSAFDYMTSEEGVSLCNNSHTTKAGTPTSSGFDNLGTSALTKTSVAATRLNMRQFRSDISERIEIGDQLALIVPDNSADVAMEIVGTPSGYETAAKTKNMLYKRHEVIPYLRLDDFDTNNWFMVDRAKMKRSLAWIDRISPETNFTVDFHTFASMFSVYFRIAYGHTDWRWIFGHNVS